MDDLTQTEILNAQRIFSLIVHDLNKAIPETYKDLPEDRRYRTKETFDEIIRALVLLQRRTKEISIINEMTKR
jgi:hypothetical protein